MLFSQKITGTLLLEIDTRHVGATFVPSKAHLPKQYFLIPPTVDQSIYECLEQVCIRVKKKKLEPTRIAVVLHTPLARLEHVEREKGREEDAFLTSRDVHLFLQDTALRALAAHSTKEHVYTLEKAFDVIWYANGYPIPAPLQVSAREHSVSFTALLVNHETARLTRRIFNKAFGTVPLSFYHPARLYLHGLYDTQRTRNVLIESDEAMTLARLEDPFEFYVHYGGRKKLNQDLADSLSVPQAFLSGHLHAHARSHLTKKISSKIEKTVQKNIEDILPLVRGRVAVISPLLTSSYIKILGSENSLSISAPTLSSFYETSLDLLMHGLSTTEGGHL